MCGIVVGMAFGQLNEKDESIRQKLLRYFTTELLIETEDRGKDATGATILFDNGKFSGIKRGERVTDFLAKFGTQSECYGSLLKVWREHNKSGGNGKIFLGHCRAGTTGDKEDNENNHPIKIRNLVGIHNGVIRNDDIIFENLKCKREVDSEAIFRLFQYYTNDGKEPFTTNMIEDVTRRLQGYFAVTLFNADNLEQIPFFRDGRPVEFIILKKYGIVLAISDIKFWKTVHYRYERLAHYSIDMLDEEMPTFIGAENMITSSLEDESAILFDLTKQIDEKTVIKDLGEWFKLPRTGKIWQSRTYSSNKNYGNSSYYSSSKPNVSTFSKNSDKNDSKRRVFDSITKKYVVKIGDKIVSDDKEITIPVDDTKNVSTAKINVSKDPSGPEMEGEQEHDSISVSVIRDDTNYDDNKNMMKEVSDTCKSIIEKSNKDTTNDTIESECKVIDVPIEQISPELYEKAKTAYCNMPYKDIGYANMEDIIEDVDISDTEKAESLGMVLVSNRVFRSAWKKGYIRSEMDRKDELKSENNTNYDEKSLRREKHIVALKSMVFFLAQCLKESDKSKLNAAKTKLANIVLSSNRKVDMERLNSVFNNYEKQSISDFANVIAKAESYKS